ncbi:MAG: argininosuccinate lyase [Christensenella sp.]|nr:argininosuccinate lyase [Christensenella sp.]
MNEKMWQGRFQKELDSRVNDFNSSISFDCRMYKEDILGSIAHATMLGKQNIISLEDSKLIVNELNNIMNDLENGNLQIDMQAEDIHMFIEAELTKRLGVVGKRLHTARSRNDQVAVDTKMYVKNQINEIKALLLDLIKTLIDLAENNLDTVMPGYTHMQRAQPITFAHHLMAYVEMFKRDLSRFNNAYELMDSMPLGSGALATTTYNIDREYTASLLGFSNVTLNSLDGVSDRDFCMETASDIAIAMVHLSRLSEEIILWCSWEFKFVELDDAYATGSSIMPQKKNPDITELVRGKTARTIGNLNTLLVMMKGLPLAYNKDMQEDKQAIFDSIDTIKICISTMIPMLATMKVNKQNMLNAGQKGFINATDCADYLVKKGLAFRDAYKITGSLVAKCIELNETLDSLPIEEYKKISEVFDVDVYNAISLNTCVKERKVIGGPSPEVVKKHIQIIKDTLLKDKKE